MKYCSQELCKTLTWRIIASTTTFTIAYCVDGTIENASFIVIFDTVIKTLFYYAHEKYWKNQTKCFQENNTESNNEIP